MAADPKRVQTVFLAALEAADRADYLNRECGDDAELRGRVEALLLAHDQPGSFLEQHAAPAGPTADMPPPAPTEAVGSVIGPYKLLQKLGEGGMGTVFLAEQEQPVKRRVALKIIKAGLDSAHVLARFEAERQALAMMDHPNIAKVLDAGSTQAIADLRLQISDCQSEISNLQSAISNGRPYFVMELVKGIPITKYCDEQHLTPTERLELFIPVCQAVQHAHQKGIIHRDLKPSNVLIALYDGKPIPKVIDFGVAKATAQKLTERTVFTEVGQMVGTLEYMAPEQAELNNLDIDTRADIYSLGVLLYELLTGSPPFTGKQLRSAAFTEMLRMIREVEPPRPSTRLSSSEELPAIAARRKLEPKKLTRLVHGELDWIVMKALEKDRNRRYETANGFAMDIQRYLADEPVVACPPSAWYRFQKFSRRNKGPLVAAALVFLALACGMAGTTWGMFQAKDAQEREAERADGEREAKQEAMEAAQAEKKAKDEAVEEKIKAVAAAEAEKQAKLEAQGRDAETTAVLSFVENKIMAAARPKNYEGGLGYDVKMADAIKAALPFVEKSFPDKPLIEARLRSTMGVSFLFLGDPKTAVEQHEKARRLYIQGRGPKHPDTLRIMSNLANCYQEAGRQQDALELRQEALRLMKVVLGPDHADTLRSMNNLAISYDHAGRQQEALKLREETLDLQKAKLGKDHPHTLMTMNNLAISYDAAGRKQEALKLREETVGLQKAKLGPDHPHTLMSMNNLATSYWAAARVKEALMLFEEVLRLQKAKLGPDHPDTLMSMNNLAFSYTTSQQAEKAMAILQESLALREGRVKALPGNDVEQSYLALTHGLVGRAEQARYDFVAASQAYARSVDMFDKLDQVGALKNPFFRGQLKIFRRRLAFCRKAEQAVDSLDFVLKQPAAEVPQLLDMRVRYLLKEQKLPAAVESAAKMKELAGNEADRLYNAACAYALCAGAKNPAADVARLTKECADQALALLKQAVARGYNNATHMRQDTDLESLRQRADFQKLLKEMETKTGAAR